MSAMLVNWKLYFGMGAGSHGGAETFVGVPPVDPGRN
jgi:hypothetical protein